MLSRQGIYSGGCLKEECFEGEVLACAYEGGDRYSPKGLGSGQEGADAGEGAGREVSEGMVEGR